MKYLLSLLKPLKGNGYNGVLLLIRVFIGCIMLTHGLPKLMNFSSVSLAFPDPIGLGSQFALVLAIFAEFACSILLILGLMTRPAAFVLFINMSVAVFIVHAGDPFQVKELAVFYFAFYLILLITGAGKFSIDNWLLSKCKK